MQLRKQKEISVTVFLFTYNHEKFIKKCIESVLNQNTRFKINVVIFDDKTPHNLISAIKPQILVKGGDYQNKDVVGEDIVDELKIVKFVADKSTSNIIESIKNLK